MNYVWTNYWSEQAENGILLLLWANPEWVTILVQMCLFNDAGHTNQIPFYIKQR